jgi:hypothetical protein
MALVAKSLTGGIPRAGDSDMDVPEVWVDQAIFTSIVRLGRAGYHVVSRSPGVTEPEATALATWAPSHGALLVDEQNQTSVNLHPLPSGRVALSRTCMGPAEYSGRGERQVYTHALIFPESSLEVSHPIALYRDALALGFLNYHSDPEPVLDLVKLGHVHRHLDPQACAQRARELGFDGLDDLHDKLATGRTVRLQFPGNRIDLVECLLAVLPKEVAAETSFSTSLQPSAVRPYKLVLVN